MGRTSSLLLNVGSAILLTACGSAIESPAAPSDPARAAAARPVALRLANAYETHSLGAGGSCPCSYENGLSGVIEVDNLAFAKDVAARVQYPDGWRDVPARYFGPGPAGRDLFVFSAPPYPSAYNPGAFTFALRYTVAGATHWDNNDGWNYHVRAPTRYQQAEGEAVLGPAATVGLGYAFFWNDQLSGGVLVKDRPDARPVEVVYSLDGWRSTRSAAARPDQPGAVSGQAWWRFDIPVPAGTRAADLAVRYQAGADSAWDNNLGQNYAVRDVYRFPR